MTSAEDLLTIVFALGRGAHLVEANTHQEPGGDPFFIADEEVSRAVLAELEDWTGVDAQEVALRG